MQTFLPYRNFEKTAQCLDYRRLGKQRVETMQIMNTLCGLSTGWANHPAVRMWENHEGALMDYQRAIVEEWLSRGYKDIVCLQKTLEAFNRLEGDWTTPEWLDDEKLHSSHRSNLLRKDYDYYCRFGWAEPDTMDYWWPTQEMPKEISFA